jgi:hypothetical protein
MISLAMCLVCRSRASHLSSTASHMLVSKRTITGMAKATDVAGDRAQVPPKPWPVAMEAAGADDAAHLPRHAR